MKKQLLAALLVIFMMASMITGCSGKSKDTGKTDSEKEVKEFTVYAFGGPPWNHQSHMDDPVGRAITKATGVKLKAESPVGDWSEAMALMIASEEYPDMVIHTGNSLVSMVDAGALRPLKKLIMDSPNLVSLYGDEIGRLAFSYEDREFYAFGEGPRLTEVRAWEYAENGFWLQLDAVKKAGFPNVRTLQDFEKVVTDYVKANPETNGQPTIGLIFSMADGWRWQFSAINSINNSSGFPNNGLWYVDPDTMEVTAVVKRPEAREFFRWVNHLNDIGLLDPENFTQSHDAALAKVANGRVVGFFDAWWQYYDAIYEVSQKTPEHDYIGFPVRMDPDNTEWRDLQSHGKINGNTGYSITTAVNDKDTQLLVDFFDYLASDEGQKLLAWGVEGEHYTFKPDNSREWKGDGKRKVDPLVWSMRTSTTDVADVRGKTGLNKYDFVGSRAVLQDGTVLQDYPADDDEYFNTRNDTLKEVLKAYGVKGTNGMFPPGYPYNINLPIIEYGDLYTLPMGQTEKTKVAVEQYREAIPRDIAKAVMAKPAQFDAEWDKFMANLENMNMPLLEKEITELLKKRLEMWGIKK